MSAERSEVAAPQPAIARQQHTADDIAFALEDLLDRMDRSPTLEEIHALTAALGRHERSVLARFFTRLSAAA
ncbi:hypothetical protein [Leifsonia shinshuensis]|uniref:Uncharacterized protein n=1 Tax=Leifsonia shinshuensis TaxID=150026 RepID=A0A853D1E1_9MICO|nr:hypothetical protein [Leifsonia shinshuensis]NYJ25234.1 hypothetical protein [Leifsonia shinshuensis]